MSYVHIADIAHLIYCKVCMVELHCLNPIAVATQGVAKLVKIRPAVMFLDAYSRG